MPEIVGLDKVYGILPGVTKCYMAATVRVQRPSEPGKGISPGSAGYDREGPMQFYDASNWRNIPRGSAAMLYIDGDYAAPADAPAQLALSHARWITVEGNHQTAGAIDWEEFQPCFTDQALADYVAGRKSMGARARVYVQRSLVSRALAALDASEAEDLATYPGLVWWIPTLDGREWTAGELQADLAANWNADLPLAAIWANQWNQIPHLGPNAKADQSTLFGAW